MSRLLFEITGRFADITQLSFHLLRQRNVPMVQGLPLCKGHYHVSLDASQISLVDPKTPDIQSTTLYAATGLIAEHLRCIIPRDQKMASAVYLGLLTIILCLDSQHSGIPATDHLNRDS
ncbi:uncharacterized protein ARMOST_20432 [Armillaria ostoyae]|uniref:Uncharacterized protein n=1 Tax=Armillaria ostoyae TaxID=47428 RepID=A0A284S7B5_ARMOS|nr:uncharacterized protein ARMOST_20432 [Armillaria ostoyae]